METDLAETRKEIGRTTIEIIRAVGERNRLASSAGRAKGLASLPMQDDRVEDALVKAVIEECDRQGVSRGAGLKILHVLMAESKRVQGIAPTASTESPMGAFAKAVELERSGKRVIRLDVGEPDFPPPRPVLEACSEALFSSKTHYTVSRGIPDLIAALKLHLREIEGYDAKESELLVTSGGRFAVYASIASLVGEGESAIVLDPNWPAYKQALNQVGAKPIVIHTTLEEGWAPSAERVSEAIRPNTKAIVLSYPNNPTGKAMDQRAFDEIVAVANERGLTVISDEAYSGYAFGDSASILKSHAKSFVLAGTFSKTWSMTGFRIGYAVSSKEVIDRMLGMVSLMLTSVPEFVQYAAIRALTCEEDAERNRKTMRARVDVACRELDRIGSLAYFRPEGAIYVFPEASAEGFQGSRFADRLLREKGVSVTPGTAFGDYPRAFRISLVQPEDVLVEGIRKIGEALA